MDQEKSTASTTDAHPTLSTLLDDLEEDVQEFTRTLPYATIPLREEHLKRIAASRSAVENYVQQIEERVLEPEQAYAMWSLTGGMAGTDFEIACRKRLRDIYETSLSVEDTNV